MFVFANILEAIIYVVDTLLTIYSFVVIVACLISWVNPDPYNPIVQIIYRLTEPAYRALRKMMPTVFNGLDLAPLILVIGLNIIDIILVNIINGLVIS